MSYPLSSPVSVGDATEAGQYNDLRRDALYLGSEPGMSGNLQQLLYLNMGRIELSRTSASVITLSASSAAPAAVMIGGVIYAAESDLTLTLSAADLETAGRCYVCAVPGSGGTFTLAAGRSVPAGSREIGTFIWSGTGIVPGTLRNIWNHEVVRASGNLKTAQGRLTAVSGSPVPDEETTEGTSVYYSPYTGNEIGLYLGLEWELLSFSELSLSISGMTAGIPYDIFVSADERGLYMDKRVWGSVSSRASSLTRIDGIPVLASDTRLRYVGTIVLNASGHVEDSKTGRLVWNLYNQVSRPIRAALNGNRSVSVTMNAWIPYYYDDAPEVRLMVPFAETEFELEGIGCHSPITDEDMNYSRACAVGISLDMNTESFSANTNCAPIFCRSYGNGPVTVRLRNSSSGFLGYHRYMLSFFTNYSYVPQGRSFAGLMGECPGIYGMIMA